MYYYWNGKYESNFLHVDFTGHNEKIYCMAAQVDQSQLHFWRIALLRDLLHSKGKLQHKYTRAPHCRSIQLLDFMSHPLLLLTALYVDTVYCTLIYKTQYLSIFLQTISLSLLIAICVCLYIPLWSPGGLIKITSRERAFFYICVSQP